MSSECLVTLPESFVFGKKTYRVLFPALLRPLTPREYQDLKNSIRKHGLKSPVLVDEEGGILDGANRARIAAELRFPVLLVRVIGNFSEQKKRASSASRKRGAAAGACGRLPRKRE